MRIKHDALLETKNTLCVRLAFLIDNLRKRHTQKVLAEMIGVSSAVLGRIRNGHWGKVSLDHVMKVADCLNLDYVIQITRRAGATIVKVTGIESAVGIEHLVVNEHGHVKITRLH